MAELLPRHGAVRAASTRRRAHVLTTAVALALLASLLAFAPSASAARPDPTEDYPRLPSKCIQPGKIIPQKGLICELTPFVKTRPTMLLWGDSHAWQHIPALQPLAERTNINLVSVVLGGCPPVKVPLSTPPGGYESSCEESNAKAMRVVSRLDKAGRPFKVMVGSNWTGYRRIYREMVRGQLRAPYPAHYLEKAQLAHSGTPPLFDWLAKKRIAVDVIAQAVTVPFVDTPPCERGSEPFVCSLERKIALPNENDTRKWLQRLMGPLAGTPGYVDVNSSVCSATRCRGLIDGIYTFYDLHHISATRSRMNQRFFMDSFRFKQ